MVSQDVCFTGIMGTGVMGVSYPAAERMEGTSSDLLQGDGFQHGLTSETWRRLVNQVESSLCREDRSRQALDQLQQLATEQGASTQFLLKSVIRETIRLTMECVLEAKDWLAGRSEPSLQDPAALNPNSSKDSPITLQADPPLMPVLTPEEREAQADASMVTALNHMLNQGPASQSSKTQLRDRFRLPAASAQVSPAVLQQQAIAAREQQLRFLCGRFHAQRQRMNLDLQAIQTKTFIALHHLQALDQGRIEQLPDDVYLRGFLRRLEPCLELPSGSLTDALPAPISRSTRPSAERGRPVPGMASTGGGLSLNYAYLAYGVLMAGGVYAIAQQGSPKSNLPPIQIDTPATPVSLSPSQKASAQQTQSQRSQPHQISHNVGAPDRAIGQQPEYFPGKSQ